MFAYNLAINSPLIKEHTVRLVSDVFQLAITCPTFGFYMIIGNGLYVDSSGLKIALFLFILKL